MNNKNSSIRVVQYGLGHIGREVVKLLLRKPQFKLVGVIDNDPLKSRHSLKTLLNDRRAPNIRVSNNASKCLSQTRPQVVLHTTGSFVKQTLPQLEQILRAGAHCISSTEELLYPQLRNPQLARKLDRLAQKNKVCILGTGVNPGFAMDLLPLCLTGICQSVKSIRITRVLNAGLRRLPLQQKIGAGLDVKEFKALVKARRLGHIGLLESMMLLANGLRWKLDRWTETIEPRIAARRLRSDHLVIPRGKVTGLHQIATGYRKGKPALVLDLSMFLGAKETYDLVSIDATPHIEFKVLNGIHGDLATVAALVNAIPQVVHSKKTGLLTMIDLPVPRVAFST